MSDPSTESDSYEVGLGPNEYIALEYPGYIRNVKKAIYSLGGEEGLAAAGDSDGGFIKLSFRPDEPMSHPIYGERQPHSALLLRISRPKGQPDQDPKLQIVGTVSSAVCFHGLADYQYLPIGSSHTTRDYSNSPAANMPERAEPSGVAEPLLCVPPLFSKNDVPFDYAYKQHQHKSGLWVLCAHPGPPVACRQLLPCTTRPCGTWHMAHAMPCHALRMGFLDDPDPNP